MFDAALRRLIDPPLDAVARGLAAAGIGANAVTLAGAAVAIAVGAAIVAGAYGWALALIVLNRVLDGLDGAIARRAGATDFGGYLDTVCDYLFYGVVPLAFAIADPAGAGAAAAAVLASFCLTASSYLAFAALAAKNGLTTRARGEKSYYAAFGVIEGGETIAFFVAFVLWPAWFAPLAWTLAALCALTTILRVAVAARVFARTN
ncbi:MAG: CDP-alcohol phosphatidyltransferase family protein [Alphaproteobacteria bacterium]|nr:CDP-alcohol phosphatidyltransferase family protein [Alphaproteobacteria bacterium]